MAIDDRLCYLLCRRCARLLHCYLVSSLGFQPWGRRHIWSRLKVAIRKEEIPAIHFHDLRYTAASRLRWAGADMDHTRKVLGIGTCRRRTAMSNEAEQLRPILTLLGSPTPSTNMTQLPVTVSSGLGNWLN